MPIEGWALKDSASRWRCRRRRELMVFVNALFQLLSDLRV